MSRAEEVLSSYTHVGMITECRPFGNGHINSTFAVTAESGRYILQKINSAVFPRPDYVMENLVAVTEHIRKKAAEEKKDPCRATLTVVNTDGGADFVRVGDEYWRLCLLRENTEAREKLESAEDMYICARAFGRFLRELGDLPAENLHETIENFHNTPLRFASLERAAKADPCGRAASVKAELEFAAARKDFAETLEKARREGALPLRVTHNDTKLNNILFDTLTGEPVAVIDLDTVMPGYSVNDFGDLIRYGATTAPEDEEDLSAVSFDKELYGAAEKGFIDGAAGALTEAEIALLPVGAMMMTLECGVRFLTDYLEGDKYFKISRPDHNLVRCRNQFALLADMERKLNIF